MEEVGATKAQIGKKKGSPPYLPFKEKKNYQANIAPHLLLDKLPHPALILQICSIGL